MIGKLNMYVEPGTIMGPTSMGELVTAHETSLAKDGGYGIPVTTFRHAQTKDFQNVQEPRSVTEHAMITPVRSPFGMIRTLDPYEMPVSQTLTQWEHAQAVYKAMEFGARMGLYGKGRNGQG